MSRRGRLLMSALSCSLVLAGCGSSAHTPSGSASPEQPGPAQPSSISVNGRSFTYRCAGTGSPTIVFESGLGDGLEGWANVFDEISAETRACAYDRPGLGGTGGSDPRLAPTFSPEDVATDLHALLSKAGIEPPYVLVGHSVAGVFLPVFAAKYQEDVVGMVLLEPSTVWEFEGRQYAELLSDMDGPLSEGGARLDVRALRTQMQDVTKITEPLVVLTAGYWLSSPIWADKAWVADHERLVREADADAIHIVVPGVGHYIQSGAPPTVLTNVVMAVAEASSSGSLPPCSDLVRDSTWVCRGS